ncbi:MAG: hypothetical protein JWR16_2249 [Nevskia sp.]|nr:hypothetical protein [Nevskia sp.]
MQVDMFSRILRLARLSGNSRRWGGALLLASVALSVQAQPWLEVGDRALRSDVELLAARGLIDGVVTTWPIPAGQLARLADDERLSSEPAFVQAAAWRVRARVDLKRDKPSLQPTADARVTNASDTVRDFGTLARDQADVRAGLLWDSASVDAALRVGEQTRFDGDNARFALDGSYVAALLGGMRFYGGWVEQWDGPGWTSSLLLSNNARPFPKIGLMRDDTHAFQTPWLSWIGPWQLNFFVGLLDGPRTDKNTVLSGLRFSFNPLPGLEIALTRDTEMCGSHHPCNPLKAEFGVRNDPQSTNTTNDEAGIDFKYSHSLGALSISPYLQFMNEDTGPFTHAYTSYLGGLSLAGPWGESGAHWRFTSEYADSVATLNWFDFGKKATGTAYNNGGYTDGYRYRDRTLGFSLDSDSRLLSLAGQLTDRDGWTYRLVYYRARINSAALAAIQQGGSTTRNVVSAQPVFINQFEAGLSVPLRLFSFDFAVRGQDAQPYPHAGGKLAVEGGISYHF